MLPKVRPLWSRAPALSEGPGLNLQNFLPVVNAQVELLDRDAKDREIERYTLAFDFSPIAEYSSWFWAERLLR